jgi:ABC-type dipeptide/oligopeptide/nickel transport system ATPase component
VHDPLPLRPLPSRPARGSARRRRRGAEVQIVFQDPYASLDPRHSAQKALDEVLRLHGRGADAQARSARIAADPPLLMPGWKPARRAALAVAEPEPPGGTP